MRLDPLEFLAAFLPGDYRVLTRTGVEINNLQYWSDDYSAAYAIAWAKAFGEMPILRDPQAYWPIDRWTVERLSGDRLDRFRAAFDAQFWSTIPAIGGAVEACHQLVDAGYRLVCISALDDAFVGARQSNLEMLGFPIADVIATGSQTEEVSPKAAAVAKLQPLVFVDDYLPYHRGLPADVHKALILRAPGGSPNVGAELANVDSQHADLQAFTEWWLGRPLRGFSAFHPVGAAVDITTKKREEP